MPTNMISLLSLPRGPAPGPSTQYYDLKGNLVQGDINTANAAALRQWHAETRARQAAAWRKKAIRTAAIGAAMVGGGALASMYAAPSVLASSPSWASIPAYAGSNIAPITSMAPAATAGRFATLGQMFNSRGAELAVNTGLSLYGQAQQNRAANQARADALASQREALALERQRLELEAQNANLDRQERAELNAAMNRIRERELAAEEEERAYRREVTEEDRGYRRARETRLEPYRQASTAALQRLQSLWGMG